MTAHLIDLYNEPAANRIAGFLAFAEGLDAQEIASGYSELLRDAPRRHERGRRYFGGRTGATRSETPSNRREEHLAVALYNASRGGADFALPDGRGLAFIDYQTPLKARRDDRGVGKIDLFGVIDGSQPCVAELKVSRQTGGLADTPLRAFLEGLAYCAIVEANGEAFAAEAQELFGYRLAVRRPALMVVAPDDYWLGYLNHPRAGEWLPTLDRLARKLESRLHISTHFVALVDAGFRMGLGGEAPRLTGNCRLVAVAELA